MTELHLTVAPDQEGMSVRSLLQRELKLSNSCIKRVKETADGLALNGQRVFTNALVHAGDRLTVRPGVAERATGVAPIPIPLTILFEDEHLLVLDKPAPLAVIPSSLSPGEATLANGLAHYLGKNFAFHPVNRLDRGTTGVMVVAKNGFIHDRLQRSLHSGSFFRQYLAVCIGIPDPPQGEIDLAIARLPGSAIRRQIDPAGQPARTAYHVQAQRDGLAMVQLTPYTGRTHQLRLHMAAIGCPLAGDWLYGTEDPALIARPALHAAKLTLIHPVTGQRLNFSAPVPADMIKLWEH